jgi:formamidopyrimidine-DNA glycosylase
MPELPDLENFASNLKPVLAGQKVQQIKVIKPGSIKDSEAELKKNLEGNELKDIYREGKELRFLFANDLLVGLHLMLNGELYLFDKTNEHKNTVIEFYFNDGKGLAVTDRQALANIKMNPVNKAGLDALSDELDANYLTEKFQRKKKIKDLLIDQDLIRGIGNAYADEILWEARISPLSIGKAIPAHKITELSKAIKQVLNNAINEIRKTHPGIITGEIRDFLKIHNPKLKQSPAGSPIKVEEIGGRRTYYTDEQELFV